MNKSIGILSVITGNDLEWGKNARHKRVCKFKVNFLDDTSNKWMKN